MTTIPAEITHLDFEVEEKKGEPCMGTKLAHEGATSLNVAAGHAQAQVRVMFGCCGFIGHWCLSCYNSWCEWAAGAEKGYSVHHRIKGTHHIVSSPMFSQVWWL